MMHKNYRELDAEQYLFNPSLPVTKMNLLDKDVDWINLLKVMLQIRRTEEHLGKKSAQGLIKTPVHLSIGQEAISAGIASNLNENDFAFGNHRSHGHYIAMGGDIYSLILEVLGKKNGCCSGMGGSMHIKSVCNGFIGSVPIVAGTIPIAVGAALYAKKQTKNNIGISFFGDGAVEEGVFHESLNFASTHEVPVLFVCENNQFSSHMHLTQRQPFLSVSRFAAANGITYDIIDGNNIEQVCDSSKKLIAIARETRQPVFLEAVTYRWRAHVGPTEDMEIGYGRRTDLPLWKKRDPIERLVSVLIEKNKIRRERYLEIDQEIINKIETYFDNALKSEYPETDQLCKWVYSLT